jgi:hypothetical protein
MMFRRHTDADQWTLLADNGQDTPISIANLSDDGCGFVVYFGDDTWGEASTLAEAQSIALSIIASCR